MKAKHVLCDIGNSTHLSTSFNAATNGDRNVVSIHTNTSIMFIPYTEISSEISPLAGFVLSNGGRPNNMHWLFSSSLQEYFIADTYSSQEFDAIAVGPLHVLDL